MARWPSSARWRWRSSWRWSLRSISLVAISRVEWPAYNSSNQLHALTTVGQFGCLAGLLASGLDLASRPPRAGTGLRACLPFRVLGRHAGDAAWRDQALPVRHLGRPAVPHGVPDPARRHRRPARHDLLRAAAVLSAGLVLDRRPARGTDGHARVGDVQAVGDRLHHDRRGAGFRVVGQHDSLRVRADRVDRHRGRHAGLLTHRAVRRDHRRAAACRVRARVVGPAGRDPKRRMGRGHRRRRLPRRRRAVLHTPAGLRGVHADDHGACCSPWRAGASNRCYGWRSSL